MVSQEIIEIVIKAKNQAEQALDKVKTKIKEIDKAQQTSGNNTSRLTQLTNAYHNSVQQLHGSYSKVTSSIGAVLNKVNQLASQGKIAIQGLASSFSVLTSPFSTVAESIKSRWQNTMENLKSKWKSTTSTLSSVFQSAASRINNTKIGFAINTAVFGTLRNQIDTVKSKLTTLKTAFNTVKSAASGIASPFVSAASSIRSSLSGVSSSISSTFSSIRTRVSSTATTISSGLGNAFSGLTSKVSSVASTITTSMSSAASNLATKFTTALSTVKTKFSEVANKAQGLQSNMSVVSQNIMQAFGQVGVSSMYQFTIGAAVARDKIMSVTESITGSKAATQQLKSAISEAASNGNVGFNNIATAVNNVGIKYNLTNQQLMKTPSLLNTIGMYAQATGKSSEQSASLMNKAYDGLNGNFLTLKRNLGITKEMLVAQGWSGAATDVDGYTAALEKCLAQKPELKSYMESYDYQMSKLKLDISAVGRQIGEAFLPYMKSIISSLNKLNKECPQVLTAVVALSVAFVSISAVAAMLMPIISVVKSIRDVFKSVREAVSLAENATKLYNTTSNGLSSIKGKISGIVTWFKNLNIQTRLTTTAQKLYNAAVRGMNGLKGIVTGVINSIKNLNLQTKIATLSQKAYNLAVNAMSGVKSVITSAITMIKNLNIATRIAAAGQALLNAVTMLNPWAIVAVAIIAVIAALIYLYNTNEDVRNTLNNIANVIKGALGNAWNWLMEVLGQVQQAWNSLMSVFNGGINLDQVWNSIVTALQGLWTWITTTLTTWGQQLYTLAVQVWNWFVQGVQSVFVTLPTQFLLWLYNCLVGIAQWGGTLYTNAVNAATQFVTGFISWISQLPTQLWTWLNNAIDKVKLYKTLLEYNIQLAASNAVEKFVTFIKTLPTKLWTWLNNSINKAKTYKTLLEYQLRTAASKAVQSFANKIKNLPTTMWNELMNVKRKIESASGALVAALKNLASQMLSKFKETLGIASPGYMSDNIENEMGYIQDNIKNSTSDITNTISELGTSMLESYEAINLADSVQLPTTEDMMTDTTNKSINIVGDKPYQKMAESASAVQAVSLSTETTESDIEGENPLSLNSEQVTADTTLIMQQYQLMTDQLTQNMTSINTQLTTTQTVMQNMTNSSTVNTQQLMTNNTQIVQSFSDMATNVQTQLNKIKTDNTNAWSNVKTTTENNLNSILSSTKSVTQKMVDAWNTMKNSIINAANKIKTDSTSHFNKLSSTIKTFYNKLQNPSGWGTPNRMSSRIGTTRRRGFSNIGSAIKSNMPRAQDMDKKVSLHTIRTSPYMNDNSTDYLGNMKKVSLSDLIRGGLVTDISLGEGAGWSDTVSPNVKYIKKITREWDMEGPVILGKYDTGLSFKVKEFENGEPNISYDTFRQMAESVFSQCHYEFYWDSAKYGNWLTAFQNGGMNCSDSTDALIAMAHACGLSASKVHGHWNSLGHFWATVEGHKMDTTGWMLKRTWTPSQSHAGPAPKGFDSLLNNSSNTDTVEHTGTVNITVEHKLSGDNLDNISRTELEEILNTLNQDTSWVRDLVSSEYFQSLDNTAKNKYNAKLLRNG